MVHFLVPECSTYTVPVLDDRLGIDKLDDATRRAALDASLAVGVHDGFVRFVLFLCRWARVRPSTNQL